MEEEGRAERDGGEGNSLLFDVQPQKIHTNQNQTQMKSVVPISEYDKLI